MELVFRPGGCPSYRDRRSQAEIARELCHRLYTLCERKKRAIEAMAHNGLVQSWPEITRLAREEAKYPTEPAQAELL